MPSSSPHHHCYHLASLNCFIHLIPPSTLSQHLSAPINPSHTLTHKLVAVKANLNVKTWPTTCGSRILRDYHSPYDATCVERLREHGAILVGSTNMDEFGMGSDGSTSAHGPTSSPWGPKHSPGGSSSGSAVAVAARAVYAALGSDTGGSVRLPAARCGVVGLLPARGSISRHGLVAYASSLDAVGVLAAAVDDCVAVLNAVAGPDGKDATCVEGFERVSTRQDQKGKRFKVGIPVDLLTKDLCASTLAAWQTAAHGLADSCELVDVSLPRLETCLPAYYVLALAEASSNLARYDGLRFGNSSAAAPGEDFAAHVMASRSALFGDEVQLRLLMGALALSADSADRFYKRAMTFRASLKHDFARVFTSVDALLLPTAPSAQPRAGENPYFQDLFTVPASLAGLAAISVPVHVCPVEKAPIGMQIVAPTNQVCVDVARRVESHAGFVLPRFACGDCSTLAR